MTNLHCRVCVFQEYNWFVVQCLDYDVATQGGSEAEALENISEALRLQFQLPHASAAAPAPPSGVPKGARTMELTVALD